MEREREWFDVTRLALCLEKLLDRVLVLRIEVPVASRAQVHTLRHVPAPELHRFADDQMIDSRMGRLGGDCQPKRPRTDNQQISLKSQPSQLATVQEALEYRRVASKVRILLISNALRTSYSTCNLERASPLVVVDDRDHSRLRIA